MRLGSEFFGWCVHGLSRYYTQEPDRHLWQPGLVLGIFGWKLQKIYIDLLLCLICPPKCPISSRNDKLGRLDKNLRTVKLWSHKSTLKNIFKIPDFKSIWNVWHFKSILNVWHFKSIWNVWYFKFIWNVWHFKSFLNVQHFKSFWNVQHLKKSNNCTEKRLRGFEAGR